MKNQVDASIQTEIFFMNFENDENFELCGRDDQSNNSEILFSADPTNYDEAMTSVHADCWKGAMDEEFSSLMEMKTWVLSDLPEGKKAIKCK